MIEFVPLDLFDDLIQDYHLGHVLISVFVLSVLGSFALSKRLLSLNVMVFGLLFLIIPEGISSVEYKLLGVALVVIGPVLYTTARN